MKFVFSGSARGVMCVREIPAQNACTAITLLKFESDWFDYFMKNKQFVNLDYLLSIVRILLVSFDVTF
jgi:hypothetical protein